jgi:hypothetical protein
MLKDPKAHYLRQRARGIHELSGIPEARRGQHYLEKLLTPAERSARNVAKLKVEDESLMKLLERSSERLEKMHSVLDDLHSTIKDSPRSRAPQRQSRAPSDVASRKK